jgi:indolepyruvate ferredoxin oxidoreductase beta subunit
LRNRREYELKARIILCGVGGQGILYAQKVLEAAALEKGERVIGCETHGMAQRGGSVISHLKVGGFHSPMVREGTADCLIAFEKAEAQRNIGFLGSGGLLFANAAGGLLPGPLENFVSANGLQVFSLDADAICLERNLKRSLNVMLLGFCAGHDRFPFSEKEIREAIARTSPRPMQEANLQAFEEGIRCARSG